MLVIEIHWNTIDRNSVRAKPTSKKKPQAKAGPRKPGKKRRATLLRVRTGARKAAIAKRENRRTEVAELLLRGLSFRLIASTVGCGLATVHRDVQASLKEWRDDRVSSVDDVLIMQNRLLDRALRKILPAVTKGELDSIDMLLKIIDRRMKLYGLDAKAVFQHWQAILAPDEQSRTREADRSLADGLRNIEAIVQRHRGGDVPGAPDHADDHPKPLN